MDLREQVAENIAKAAREEAFETCAVCRPAVTRTHEQTQWLSCHKMSAHSAWYHDFTHPEVEEQETVALPL